jgi:hypothetical protein
MLSKRTIFHLNRFGVFSAFLLAAGCGLFASVAQPPNPESGGACPVESEVFLDLVCRDGVWFSGFSRVDMGRPDIEPDLGSMDMPAADLMDGADADVGTRDASDGDLDVGADSGEDTGTADVIEDVCVADPPVCAADQICGVVENACGLEISCGDCGADERCFDYVCVPELSGASGGDQFGSSIAISESGDTILVGAPGAGTDGCGRAFVFALQGSAWSMTQTLQLDAPCSTGAEFGADVEITGEASDQFVVGAPASQIADAGQVAAFGSIDAIAQGTRPLFGRRIDVFWYPFASESLLVVAAADPGGVSMPGNAAGVFFGGWQANGATVVPTEPVGSTAFGTSVLTFFDDGDVYMLVGDPGANEVVIFRYDTSEWDKKSEINYLTGSQFGAEMDMSGDFLLVSAPATTSAHVYRGDTDRWSNRESLPASSPADTPHFGYAVAIRDPNLVIGAPGLDPQYPSRVQFFLRDESRSNKWDDQVTIEVSESGDAGFGSSVVVHEDWVVVGSPLDGPGRVYIFPRTAFLLSP